MQVNEEPKKRSKMFLLLWLPGIYFFFLLAPYVWYGVNFLLYPPKPSTVIRTKTVDICDLLDKKPTSHETMLCRWVFSAKYPVFIHRQDNFDGTQFFTNKVTVPLIDIDLSSTFRGDATVVFDFGNFPTERYSPKTMQGLVENLNLENKVMYFDVNFYRGVFKAFDGQLVFFSYGGCTYAKASDPTIHLVRMVGESTAISVLVSVPNSPNVESCKDYIRGNAYRIDRQLRKFTDKFKVE